MNSTKENSTNQSERIRAISKKLIPICWIVIFFVVAGVTGAGIQLSGEESNSGEYKLGFTFTDQAWKNGTLFGTMVFSALYWVVLILLIMRFLKSCDHDGIFSVSSSKSIRWIGRLILIETIFKLVVSFVTLSYLYIASNSYIASFIPSFTFSITKLILGFFLLVVARIIMVGVELEKDSELTI